MARQPRSAMPKGGAESGAPVASDLQNIGIHTDEMAEAVQNRVSELQELVEDEIRRRPLRVLLWAAATGFVFGVLAARS